MKKWIAGLLLVVVFVVALIWIITGGLVPQADLGASTVAGQCLMEVRAGAEGPACAYFEKNQSFQDAQRALREAQKNLVAAQAAYEKKYRPQQATPVGR